jgi:hypothetical protein
MATNHWLIVTSPENIATTRDLGYTLQGFKNPRPLSDSANTASHCTVNG